MESWRVYALGLVLGGFVAGAIGWYFEAEQITVVATKFWSYADLGYAASGHPVTGFSIYPLFNKYGTMDLGPSSNGVRLFFNESLSGVVNWGIAAPLFSINFFILAALFQRSLAPFEAARQRPGIREPRRAGRSRAAVGPLDGAGHQLVPAPVTRSVLVQPGRRRAYRGPRR